MFCFLLPALTLLYPPAALPRVLCIPEMVTTTPVTYVKGPFMDAYTPPPSTNPLDAYASAIDPVVMYTRGPFMSAYDVKR